MRWPAGSTALLACAALLSACATPPAQPPQASAGEPHAPHRAEIPPLADTARPAPVDIAAAKPLDGSRLPPFDGEKQNVREPLRGLATVDLTVPPDDLWQRIRAGFSMPNLEGTIVQDRTAWYAARPEALKRMFERSRRYLYHIVSELEMRGMPTELALLPMVESSFNPMAYSRSHASGLWQFIPGTGKRYDLAQNWWYDGRRDIVASTSAALDYLRDIYEMNGDWHLALASYNWGENAVAKAIARNRAAGLPTDYSSLRMPEETRHYVPKLQALKNIIADPAPFGIVLEPIPNRPYFATIPREKDIDIRLAAKLAEMTVEDFVALNPAFNRPIIPAAENARIVLPADKVEVFHANLEKYDEKALVTWQTYQPKRGESLETIARKFDVSLARLREVNGITPRTRRIPTLLVVPIKGAATQGASLPLMYAPPTPVSATGMQVHTVKRGETLYSIARQYQVTPDDLRRWNPMGRILQAGQKLRLQTTSQPLDEVKSSNKKSNKIIIKKTKHKVKK